MSPPPTTWRILCDSPELAVECLEMARRVDLAVEPTLSEDWLGDTTTALGEGETMAASIADTPTATQLVKLSEALRAGPGELLLTCVGAQRAAGHWAGAAADQGIVMVHEVGPLIAALALKSAGCDAPWTAGTRLLPEVDTKRMSHALTRTRKKHGQLTREDGGVIGWRAGATDEPTLLGSAQDTALAIAALHDADAKGARIESSVDGVDTAAVQDIMFGPPRALSDPASKALLDHYGLPLPAEELCTSPSRAAAEASRLGYPVRISLASPDLRIWDHPDLAVDMVDNAARVRDSFRQLMGLARARLAEVSGEAAPERRLLGVMVTATSPAQALLYATAMPVGTQAVALELGFADPHGRAASDGTRALLPARAATIERMLSRLQGSALILGGRPGQRQQHLSALSEVLLRLCAFVQQHHQAVERVEIRPLALLLDGSAEVREACVTITDLFERSMSDPADASGF